MPTWEHGAFWHHVVHERLGEKLHYYFVRIQAFDPDVMKPSLEETLRSLRVGSFRVFPVFGQFDLIVRAWLHPTIENQFRACLDGHIEGARGAHPFAVTHIDHRYYWDKASPETLDKQLLETLDDEIIKTAQREDEEALQRLYGGKLVLERHDPTNHSLLVFVAIHLENVTNEIHHQVVRKTIRFLHENPEFLFPSVYSGYGFCHILVKTKIRLKDYFKLERLPNYLGSELRGFVSRTETYLAHRPEHLLGWPEIGDSTFTAIQGRDLFIEGIIPEFYTDPFSKADATAVGRFLTDNVKGSALGVLDRKLLRDYLLGFLHQKESDMKKTIANFVIDHEGFLRDRHKEFCERITKQPVHAVYEAAEIGKSNDLFTLHECLKIYGVAIKSANLTDKLHLCGGWEPLAQVRNAVLHGRVNLVAQWKEQLQKVLSQLPRLRELVALIETETRKKYPGSY
jgi:hypothetical protein